MIEKSLIIIIFMYISGFSILGAQYIWGDVFGVTMTNMQSQPLKNNLIVDINTATLNKVTGDVLATNQTSITLNAVGEAASIGWDLVLLATGTYVFDILLQLGVPIVFVGGIVAIYIILLVRSILGWIRGI